MRAQIFRKLFLVASTPDRDRTEPHLPRKLDTEMPEPTNALHSDQVSGPQAGVAKGVVGCNSRTKERGGLCGTEFVRNGSDPTRFSDHHFRISSIHGYSRNHGVLTIHSVSAPARFAKPILPSDQADTNSLTDFPPGYSRAQRLNATNHFMPRNARQSQARVGAGDRGRVGVTDSACFHSNPNLACSRLRDWPFYYS